MKPRLQATRAVRELIKAYEPFHADAVRRGRRWVIGWGHRATAKEGASIKPDDAELLLIYDALRAQDAVDAMAGGDMPKASRDALASFAASIGLSAFMVSDVSRLAKAGRLREAGAALDSWVRAEEDGRLVVSDRLVERRRAEKTLLLEGLDGPAATVAEAADAEPETPADMAPQDEPRLGPLVDVDIAFEDEPALVEPSSADAGPVEAPEGDGQPEFETPAVDHAVDPADEAALGDEDALDADDADDARDVEDGEPEAAAADPDAPDGALEEDDRKSQQDASIAAVMSRMASDMARSVGASAATAEIEPAAEPEPPVEPPALEEASTAPSAPVRLGYSFLKPATVTINPDMDPDAPNLRPAASDGESEPEAAEPEAAETEAAEPAEQRETAPTPVYGTVSVSTPPAVDSVAPPHPAMAPASAPGLSGESEGPDHPEEDEADTTHEDEALEPAMVAGPEAGDRDTALQAQKSSDWLFPAILGVGVVMTGLGVWALASDWQGYMAHGLDNGPVGPVAFGSGLLLTVGAGWMMLSRR